MSCLTTFTEDAKQDLLDTENFLNPIITEIDQKLHDIETTLLLIQETLVNLDARITALEDAP